MPRKHSNPTLSFRPSSWQRALIEARVSASGLYKKEFIARSCIYSNIVVVGNKHRIQFLVDELRETQIIMKEIVEQIVCGNFSISKNNYRELKEDYLAFIITMVEILDGASYLFDKKPDKESRYWKEKLALTEYRNILNL